MNASIRSIAALLAVAAGPLPSLADLRCPGGLVSVGAASIDLLARCGPPALRDRRVDERWIESSAPADPGRASFGRRLEVIVEDWSYDFGPGAFTTTVRLENGRIVRFSQGSYGLRPDPPAPVAPPRARCDEHALRAGQDKLEVLSRCGEPAVADEWDETEGTMVTDGHGFAAGQSTTTRVERWTYDLGRDRFIRFVHLRNGRVVAVSTGGYGYAD